MAEVLVVGSGGREHAIGLGLYEEGRELYFSPGNAGTAELGENLDLSSNEDIVAFARQQNPDLVVVGPEAPLVAGLADQLRAEGVAVFGPGAEAAQLESSKSFATEFMRQFRIPHPDSEIVVSTRAALETMGSDVTKWVIKADGLAGGKGVVLPDTQEEAERVLTGMFSGELFDGAGRDRVVIQERLHGPEVSAFVVTDGEDFIILPYSQDHKRLKDGDEGPNTGGMGAYAPLGELVDDVQEVGIIDIARKTIEGLRSRGIDYRGVIYLGLMLAEERGSQPVVIEYNVRFGDPETQVVLPLVQRHGNSLYGLFSEAAKGKLENSYSTVAPFQYLAHSALTVCLAAQGYPNTPRKGDTVYGPHGTHDWMYEDVTIHQGGTKASDGKVLTNGGRVLYVTALGETIDEAAAKAYSAIGEGGIHFKGMQYRTDIGWQLRSRR